MREQHKINRLKACIKEKQKLEDQIKSVTHEMQTIAQELILPFLADTTKCRVKVSEFDFGNVEVLSTDAWTELLTIFKAINSNSFGLGNGWSVDIDRDKVQLYADLRFLKDNGIPADISSALKCIVDQRQSQIEKFASQADELKRLPGAYTPEDWEV